MASKKLYLEKIAESTPPGDASGKEQEKKKLDKRQWIILISLMFGNFCHGTCYSLQAPFFPKEAESKRLTPTQYGFVFSVYELAKFIFAIIAGKMIFFVHPKTIVIGGQFLLALSVVSFGFLDRVDHSGLFLGLAIFVRIVEGIAAAVIKIAANAIGATVFPNNITSVFATLQSSIGVGIIVAPLLGGLLYDAFGYTVPFLLVGGMSALAAFIYFLILPASKREEDAKKTCEKPEGSRKKLFTDPGVLIYAAGIFTVSNFMGYNNATLEPHLRPHGYSSTDIGILSATLCTTFVLVSPIVGRMCDRKADTRILSIVSCLMLIVGTLFIGPMPFIGSKSTWTVSLSSATLIGLAYAFLFGPAFRGITEIAVSKGFGKGGATCGFVSSITTSAHALGACVGPALGGCIVDTLGYDAGISILATLELFKLLILVVYTTVAKCKESLTAEENVKPISIITIVSE